MLAVGNVAAAAVGGDGTCSFEPCCLPFRVDGFGTELGSPKLTTRDRLVEERGGALLDEGLPFGEHLRCDR